MAVTTVPAPKKPKNYLNNKDLLAEVRASKLVGQMSNTLALMLTMLCKRYASRGNFVNYTYNDDMQSYAMLMLVKSWASFNPDVSNNPFAFYTQCIKNSFIQYLNKEQKHRDIRDALLTEHGLTPSFHCQDQDDDMSGGNDNTCVTITDHYTDNTEQDG